MLTPPRRSLWLLAAPALVCSTACATLTRGDRGQIELRDAPADLEVLDHGKPVKVAREGATVLAPIDYKAKSLTVRTAGKEKSIPVDAHAQPLIFVADYLMLVFPAFIDAGSQKWNDFDPVSLRTALSGPGAVASPTASGAAATSKPPARPRSRSGLGDGLLGRALSSDDRSADEPAGAQPSAPQTAAPQPSPAEPAHPAPEAAAKEAGGRRLVLAHGMVAVLDFRNFSKDLKAEDIHYFTDVVRGAALRAAPGLNIITRENLLVLLEQNGRVAGQCEGECEVDTGRRIGADAVISGELLKLGSRYKLSLRLHDTKSGRLLSTSVATGKSIDQLDENAQKAATDLLFLPQ